MEETKNTTKAMSLSEEFEGEQAARRKFPNIAKLADLLNQFENPAQLAAVSLSVASGLMNGGSTNV